MKRALSLTLVLLMLLASVPALAYEARNDQEKALMEYEDVMPMAGFGSLWGLASYDDHTAAWMLDTFKIDQRDLEIDVSDNFKDLARARLAAEDIPDYIVTLDRQLAMELAESGQFYDMSEVIYEHAPGMVDFIGEDVLDRYRSTDGKLYIIPGQTSPADELDKYLYAQDAAMVNIDLLTETGLEAPTNVDELYAYLLAIKDMEVNGQKVIPIVNPAMRPKNYTSSNYPMNIPKMLYMFSPGTGYTFLDKNDETKMVDLHYDNAAYLEYLTFFNKLYREGLMDQDGFTMSDDQYIERLKSGIYGYTFEGTSYISTANSAASGEIMRPYYPIRFPRNYEGGSDAFNFPMLGDWFFLFNKNISDPVRVAKLLDWNYTVEGVRVINYGAPDETMEKNCWYYDDAGEPVFNQELQQQWDEADYTWNWMVAGGWGYHAVGLRRQLKYTGISEMGICVADDLYLEIDRVTQDDLSVSAAYEAMNLQPVGPIGLEKGPQLCDLLNKWEVQIVLRAEDEAQVASMYQQMMEEARGNNYDELKMEMYDRYIAANPQ
ncbi:hypothetical protein LJC33_04840 [Eubacteriales bacterium OttesenSCG-928-N13]|nr:hypothetical protein [Eubacteriales bacterium OttesenSCG-928-N13]